jgi:hypothetical protein
LLTFLFWLYYIAFTFTVHTSGIERGQPMQHIKHLIEQLSLFLDPDRLAEMSHKPEDQEEDQDLNT